MDRNNSNRRLFDFLRATRPESGARRSLGTRALRLESLEGRQLLSATPAPALVELAADFVASDTPAVASATIVSLEGARYDFGDLRRVEALGLNANSEGVVWNDEGRLAELTLADANIQRVDLAGCEALEKLDVSGCENLRSLKCQRAAISELDLSQLSRLRELQFDSGLESVETNPEIDLALKVFASDDWSEILIVDDLGMEISARRDWNSFEFNVPGTAVGPIEISYLKDGEVAAGTTINESERIPYDDGDLAALESLGLTPRSPGVVWSPEGRLIELTLADPRFENVELLGSDALQKLDVSGCENLVNLDCGYNSELTELNVAGCQKLEILFCIDSCLTSLDLSDCPSLVEVNCTNNALRSIDLSGCPNLEKLVMHRNFFEELDFSAVPNLKILAVANTPQLQLDLSPLTELEELHCNNCGLQELNFSNNRNLQVLQCSENELTELDVSGLANLRVLNCYNNYLASLDVSGCESLWTIFCHDNLLTSLDLSGCPKLEWFDGDHNRLESLDFSNCPIVNSIYVNDNVLQSLNVNGRSELLYLHCRYNFLTELDVSTSPKLESFYCDSNYLESVNVSGCERLKYFSCAENYLTTLDASRLPNLRSLGCYYNPSLSELYVNNCAKLDSLYVDSYLQRIVATGSNDITVGVAKNYDYDAISVVDGSGTALETSEDDYAFYFVVASDASYPIVASYYKDGELLETTTTIEQFELVLAQPTLSASATKSAVVVKINPVDGADQYVVEFSEDPNFENVATKTYSAPGVKTFSGLSKGTEYYVRVKATALACESDWAEISVATKSDPQLASPILAASATKSAVVVKIGSVEGAETPYSLSPFPDGAARRSISSSRRAASAIRGCCNLTRRAVEYKARRRALRQKRLGNTGDTA